MINNNFYLFFNCRVNDLRRHDFDDYRSSPLANWEKWRDVCLSESRYWLGGKKIELFDNKYVILTNENRQFATSINKMKSLALAFFLFIPGICLKGLGWLDSCLKINRRNNLIIEILKKQENFPDNRLCRIETRNFKSLSSSVVCSKAGENRFFLLPFEITAFILSRK